MSEPSMAQRSWFRLPMQWRFCALLIASTQSNLADGLFKLAFPLVALQLTREPALIAGVSFALTVPWLLFSLPVGVLVDRWDRCRTVQVANTIRVGVLLSLTLLAANQRMSLPLLYMTALLLGIAETFADTASGALLPSIVLKPQLERANARLVGAQTITNQFIGPPLGGMLASISTTLTMAVSGGLYLLAVVTLLPMTGEFRPTRATRQSLFAESVEGVRYIWHHPLIRTLVMMLAVMNFCWSGFSAVLVLYAVAPGPVGLTPWQYGLLLTGVGLGGVMGSFVAEPGQRLLGCRWLIAADVVGTCIMLLIPAISANRWAIGGAAILAGIGGSVSNIVLVSLRQRIVPEQLLGRVGGALRMVSYGALALGAAIAGFVAQLTDVRIVFAGGAVLVAFLLIPLARTVTPNVIQAALASGDP